MKIEIVQADLGTEKHLAGRVVGDRLYDRVIVPALKRASDATVLLLSFRGVESATGSVFKATWQRLHPKEGVVVPSMVAHLADDVRSEFAIYVRSERLAGLEALDWSATAVRMAALHGDLEDSAWSALTALVKAGAGATAPQLQNMSDGRVSPTAWTNRLNELHRQGLAGREKAGGGRAWLFFPLAKEIRRG